MKADLRYKLSQIYFANQFTSKISNFADNCTQKVASLFLDFSKAFDTVDHNILIDKLNYYGILGVANDLINSYLSNRTQFVEIDGNRSRKSRLVYCRVQHWDPFCFQFISMIWNK